MSRTRDQLLRQELDATLMMLESPDERVLLVAVVAAEADAAVPESEAVGRVASAVSDQVARRHAEVFVHALRREADRIEALVGGLTTRLG